MHRDSSHLQAEALRSALLICGLAALVLVFAVTVAAACRAGASHPGKAPSSQSVSPGKAGSAPSTSKPKPAPPVKACPASTRLNPKTGRCERYRF
jgi:hypothetical protein